MRDRPAIDATTASLNNARVIRLSRATAVLLVAPFLTFASRLAPQHVHEPGPGHDQAVAHSHFAPHDEALHESDTTEIEHDIEHVIWLDSAILHQPIHEATHVPRVLPVSDETLRPAAQWSVLQCDDAHPAHGPPKRAYCFRGPPRLV
jgi:hypothetical protein